MKDYEVDACYDITDERDYTYSDTNTLLWGVLPESYILDNVVYQNQGMEEITKMMCVYYSTWHWINEENFQEWSSVRVINKELWLKALELWRLDVKLGSLVSDWPRTARDEWYIKWWTLVRTVEEMKNSLLSKQPVVVWANKIDWKKWYKSPFIVWGNKWSGHAVLIIWYDDNYEGWCFIIKNSYWTWKYDTGKMYLKYEDFGLLFPSKYSLIDEEDIILKYKKEIMEWINIKKAEDAFELWIWNWLDATKWASREETATMILRAIEKLKNWDI